MNHLEVGRNVNQRLGFSSDNSFIIWDFPGGERGLRCNIRSKCKSLFARINTPKQLMDLLLAANALKNMGVLPETLELGYFPYARQDRITCEGEALSVQVIADLIDNLGFREVKVLDPHSNVLAACFKKTRFVAIPATYYCKNYLDQIRFRPNTTFALMAPDAGAVNRVLEVSKIVPATVIFGSKKRDSKDGKLSGFQIINPEELANVTDLAIVDDICDGGGTFIGIADMIRNINPNIRMHLWVTHGIFSGKASEILPLRFTSIGTTDSWQSEDSIKDLFLSANITPTVISYWR